MAESFHSADHVPVGTVKRVLSAAARPDRVVYLCDATGSWQVYGWDRASDTHRQLTSHPHGVNYCALSPDGGRLVWFADPDGGEQGEWRQQSWDDPPVADRPLMPTGFGPQYPQGIEVGSNITVVAFSSREHGFSVYTVSAPDGAVTKVYGVPRGRDGQPDEPKVMYESFRGSMEVGARPPPIPNELEPDQPIVLRGLSADARLVALQDSTRYGDPERPQTRVLSLADDAPGGDRTVALLDHGFGREVVPVTFLTHPDGRQRLLVQYEDSQQRRSLLLWDPDTGTETPLPVGPEIKGELANRWDVCCYRMLAEVEPSRGRLVFGFDVGPDTRLYDVDLSTGQLTLVDTPDGTINELNFAPDGSLEYQWGTMTVPWQHRRTDSGPVPFPHTGTPTPSGRFDVIHVDGRGGPIPTYLIRPRTPAPAGGYPTIVWVHGGPRERWGNQPLPPIINEMLARGCQIALPIYRGSLGNGNRWRDANYGLSGRVEVEDVADVARYLQTDGPQSHDVDPHRITAWGSSYGGYVLLTSSGMNPGLFSAVVASSPMVDPLHVYYGRETRPEFPAALVQRYGGTPGECPERWVAPFLYAPGLTNRALVTYNRRDPRTPPGSTKTFVGEARLFYGTDIKGLSFAGGHHPIYQSRGEQNRVLLEQIEFLVKHVTTVAESPTRLGSSVDPRITLSDIKETIQELQGAVSSVADVVSAAHGAVDHVRYASAILYDADGGPFEQQTEQQRFSVLIGLLEEAADGLQALGEPVTELLDRVHAITDAPSLMAGRHLLAGALETATRATARCKALDACLEKAYACLVSARRQPYQPADDAADFGPCRDAWSKLRDAQRTAKPMRGHLRSAIAARVESDIRRWLSRLNEAAT